MQTDSGIRRRRPVGDQNLLMEEVEGEDEEKVHSRKDTNLKRQLIVINDHALLVSEPRSLRFSPSA